MKNASVTQEFCFKLCCWRKAVWVFGFGSWWNTVRGSCMGFAFVMVSAVELASSWELCCVCWVSQVSLLFSSKKQDCSSTCHKQPNIPRYFKGEAVLELTVISANLWLFEKLADTNMKLSTRNHKGTKTEKKEAVLQTKTELLEDEWKQSQCCLLKQDRKIPAYGANLFTTSIRSM